MTVVEEFQFGGSPTSERNMGHLGQRLVKDPHQGCLLVGHSYLDKSSWPYIPMDVLTVYAHIHQSDSILPAVIRICTGSTSMAESICLRFTVTIGVCFRRRRISENVFAPAPRTGTPLKFKIYNQQFNTQFAQLTDLINGKIWRRIRSIGQ